MEIRTNGKNIEITEGMQGYLEKKLKYFNKFLKEDTPVNLNVSKRGNTIKIEAYLQYFKKDVKAKVEGDEFYSTVDKLMDVLKNKISDLHKKMTNRTKFSLRDQYKAEQLSEIEELSKEENNE